jgi:AcrR family transcriptional regulator
MRRASTAQKKEQRRASIREQARAYIGARSFDEIRLSDLARELGLVKGTLYLYFPTKQDLFVSILVEEMEAWWAQCVQMRATRSPGRDLALGLGERVLLVRLMASLHMTIEPGLSPAGLRGMKSWFRDFAVRASKDLEERYEGIAGKGLGLVMCIYALAVGAAQLAFPPGNVRRLIENDKSLSVFRIDFDAFLAESIDALYLGTRRMAGGNPRTRSASR